ncbi:MAG: orotidine-5'-phosphate decarboxylase [Saprospiraceae bacterium]|nr:orotidine-5'-phosphate decarboxylase [Saprospiraceae bacterium]
MIVKDKKYLTERIRTKKSFLCIGLDPDLKKIPSHYSNSKEPLLDFCLDVVGATQQYAVSYKINIAFFENHGPEGWHQLEKLVQSIPEDIFIIADAKRADIGNTSEQYAGYYFKKLNADALTLHPYMGYDSIEPFLKYQEKWSVILGLTSNPGSEDFETVIAQDGTYFFEKVLEKFSKNENAMFVIGATQAVYMKKIRNSVPNHFLLIPGVGEQGGDLQETVRLLRNDDEGILINVSRGILYPKGQDTTMQDIEHAAIKYTQTMNSFF